MFLFSPATQGQPAVSKRVGRARDQHAGGPTSGMGSRYRCSPGPHKTVSKCHTAPHLHNDSAKSHVTRAGDKNWMGGELKKHIIPLLKNRLLSRNQTHIPSATLASTILLLQHEHVPLVDRHCTWQPPAIGEANFCELVHWWRVFVFRSWPSLCPEK